ncbi:MAG: carotenoid biosynthesis protein [Chloroflexota bacterium]
MQNPYFITFEIIAYSLSALCFVHAFKKGTGNVLRLLAGILFGLLLELATIRQLNAYEYGLFPVMVLDVPLCIGVSWGSILYSAMEFSDASSLPYFLRPVLDGLLALNIDLATDTIAIRLGMWDWGQGLEFQYFGVPYANFWAWFWVISSFSFGYRLLARRNDRLSAWLSPLLALFSGLTWVLATNWFITAIIPFEYHGLVVLLLLAGALGGVAAKRPRFYRFPAPTLVFWVPFISHLFFLVTGLVSGVILDPTFLLGVSLLMFVVALALHRPSIAALLSNLKPSS